ncbi:MULTISPECIES: STAS domain-containing protein [unclassified Streptomyces]|uniref:STAS domain-containing protein n=1 Tax=unclassified Streptomyces TaxID=2593676 RepID=UPI0035E0C9E5
MTQHLTVHTRTTTAGAVIELIGELDHHTAPEAHAALLGTDLHRGQQLVLDLTGLTFCDSSGITVMIAARNHVLASHATVVLAAVPDRVSRVLRVIGLDQVFPVHPTVEAAEAAWRPTVG